MTDKLRINRNGECDVCGLAHDEEIHEATMSVHRWFRSHVTQYFFEEQPVVEEQVA